MNYDYDLFVIGAGSGGVRAARMSAGYGARVAIAESRYLGGTCVNVGCVPKKLFVYGSHFREEFEDAAAYGWDIADRSFHWPRLRDNKTREIQRLNDVYQHLLDDAGVTIRLGRAQLTSAHMVVVDGVEYTAEHILIATGSWPRMPDIPGIEHAITSNEAFFLEQFPERVAVIGGGYIAAEFAGIFNGLGAETDLLYRGPMLLRGFDDSVRHFVAREMAEKGIALRFETTVERIEASRGGKVLHLNGGHVVEVDLVLFAIGRTPNVSGLGLETVGVATNDRGAIEVDESYRSSIANIYALGDVIDRNQLTPVAIAEGMCVAANLFSGRTPSAVDYNLIPTAVFCQPNVGTVGPTEAEAAAIYPNLKVYETQFRPLKHTLSGRNERTLMKLLVNGDDDRVLAAHMVGPEAGEIIQGLAVAITAGATKAEFDRTIGIHPTAAEEFVTMREPVR